jgi:hypothetical protein
MHYQRNLGLGENMSFLKTGVITLGTMLVAAQAYASQPLPDVESSRLAVTYDGSSSLTVQNALPYFDNMDSVAIGGALLGVNIAAFDTTYDLQANINTSGSFSSGTFEIDSDYVALTDAPYTPIYDGSSGMVSVIQGTLTSFGYSGDILHFAFNVTGGVLSTDGIWGSTQGEININVIDPNPSVNFGHPFADSTMSTSDVFSVPTPQAGIAGAGLLGALAVLRRRRIASV